MQLPRTIKIFKIFADTREKFQTHGLHLAGKI